MELTLEYIKAELDGFYPNSTRLTPKILSEMFGMLRRLHWTEDDFSRTLLAYRNEPLRMETKTLNIPPDVRQLMQLWKKNCSATPKHEPTVPTPGWYRGCLAAYLNDKNRPRLSVALYMLEQAENHPEYKLDRAAWYEEADYCMHNEPPKHMGNLAMRPVLQGAKP